MNDMTNTHCPVDLAELAHNGWDSDDIQEDEGKKLAVHSLIQSCKKDHEMVQLFLEETDSTAVIIAALFTSLNGELTGNFAESMARHSMGLIDASMDEFFQTAASDQYDRDNPPITAEDYADSQADLARCSQ